MSCLARLERLLERDKPSVHSGLCWPSLAQLASAVQVFAHSEVTKFMGCYCAHVPGLLVAFLLCCEIWWHDDIRRENDFHGNLDYSYFRHRSILVHDPVDFGKVIRMETVVLLCRVFTGRTSTRTAVRCTILASTGNK